MTEMVELVNLGDRPYHWPHGGNTYVINPKGSVYKLIQKHETVVIEDRAGRKKRCGIYSPSFVKLRDGDDRCHFLRVPAAAARSVLSGKHNKPVEAGGHGGKIKVSKARAEELGQEVRAQQIEIDKLKAEREALERAQAALRADIERERAERAQAVARPPEPKAEPTSKKVTPKKG